jgi:lysophospholipase L1-like esterase
MGEHRVAAPATGRRLSLGLALVTVGLLAWMPVPFGGAPAPPDRAEPLRVMAFGDSITRDGMPGEGYRGPLRDLLVGQDHLEIEFVGTQRNGNSELAHEGHGGFRIDQLRGLVDEAMASQAPDVVLLHAGSNDIGQGNLAWIVAARLQDLTSRICTLRPRADLFVASIIPIVGLERVVDAYNAQIPGIVAQLQVGGCRAHFVDLHAVVAENELPDKVHPDPEGYQRLAEAWYPLVRKAYEGAFAAAVPSSVNDDVLLYTGDWQHDIDRPGAYRSDRHVSAKAGDTAAYGFSGSVVVIGSRGPDGGVAAISVDGGAATMVDLYAPQEQQQVAVYRSPSAGPGGHVLTVRVAGPTDPASGGTAVTIDRLDLAGP